MLFGIAYLSTILCYVNYARFSRCRSALWSCFFRRKKEWQKVL